MKVGYVGCSRAKLWGDERKSESGMVKPARLGRKAGAEYGPYCLRVAPSLAKKTYWPELLPSPAWPGLVLAGLEATNMLR